MILPQVHLMGFRLIQAHFDTAVAARPQPYCVPAFVGLCPDSEFPHRRSFQVTLKTKDDETRDVFPKGYALTYIRHGRKATDRELCRRELQFRYPLCGGIGGGRAHTTRNRCRCRRRRHRHIRFLLSHFNNASVRVRPSPLTSVSYGGDTHISSHASKKRSGGRSADGQKAEGLLDGW